MKDQLKQIFLRNWTPAEKTLLLLDVLLSGVLLGWLTSPFRKSVGKDAELYVETLDDDEDEESDDDEEDEEDTIEIEIENDEEDE